MHTYQLTHDPVQWPHKCAACGAPATATVEASCSVVTGVGYYVLFVRTTHLRTKIRYPVCARHLWIAHAAGAISARNLFNLALGVLWAFPALALAEWVYGWLFESIPIRDPQLALVYAAIVAVGIAVFVLGRRLTPVKLNAATQDTVTLSIGDDDYARDFEKLNAGIILKTLPRWRA